MPAETAHLDSLTPANATGLVSSGVDIRTAQTRLGQPGPDIEEAAGG